MSVQEKKGKPVSVEGGRDPVKSATAVAEKGKKIAETADDLIQEIDLILEQNAADFVRHFVQRSGE